VIWILEGPGILQGSVWPAVRVRVLRRTSILVRLSLASPSSSSQYAAATHRRSLKRTHQSSSPSVPQQYQNLNLDPSVPQQYQNLNLDPSVPQQYQNLNLDPWTLSPPMTLINHGPHSSTTVVTPTATQSDLDTTPGGGRRNECLNESARCTRVVTRVARKDFRF
jgi:hypothetical protein